MSATTPSLSRRLDPRGGAGEGVEFSDVCLVTALRNLGVLVPYVTNGPFRALRDGNRFLEPFGKHLARVGSPPSHAGLFVVWKPGSLASSRGHFVAVIVGDTVTVKDGESATRLAWHVTSGDPIERCGSLSWSRALQPSAAVSVS